MRLKNKSSDLKIPQTIFKYQRKMHGVQDVSSLKITSRSFFSAENSLDLFEQPELEDICGINRQTYHNYREGSRSIPVEVYESLFDFYSQIYAKDFDFEGDIYPSGLERSRTDNKGSKCR